MHALLLEGVGVVEKAREMLEMAGRREGAGTANSTTFLPANTSDVLNFSMPSGPSTRKVASGRRSPIPILMVTSGGFC
jgi:hypothetical protein